MFVVNVETANKKQNQQQHLVRLKKNNIKKTEVSITAHDSIAHNRADSITQLIITKNIRQFINKKLSNDSADIPSQCGYIIQRLIDSVQFDDQFFLS